MTSRILVKSFSIAAAIVISTLAACTPGGPSLPGLPEATTPPPGQATQPSGATTAPQAEPTRSGLLSASTALIDETADVSAAQGGKIEMNFSAPAMQPVSIATTLASGTPTYQLAVVDLYGNFLATYKSDPTQGVESIPELTLPYKGPYKLVYDSIDGEGSLAVKVTALAKATGGGEVEPGASLDGLMGAFRTYHTYQFALEQGQSVTIATTASEAGTLDTSIVLYGPDGHYLTDADDINAPTNLDAQINDFVAPMSGTFTAIVTSKDQNTGSYNFSIAVDTAPPAAQGPADIVYDKEYRANFTDKSNLVATFDGSIGDVLKIGATKVDTTVGIDIYLISPFGQILGFAVNTGKGRDTAVNEIQLPYSGRFTLEMRPVGDGQATFQITHLTDAPTGGGILSDTQTKLPGVLSQPNVFHVYQFEVSAGDKVSLAAFSVSKKGTLDLGFALIGPNGHQLLFADDSPTQFPKDPELTNYEIMQGGTYLVVVYSFSTATGTYDFVFTRK